jgi:hypothetical protein
LLLEQAASESEGESIPEFVHVIASTSGPAWIQQSQDLKSCTYMHGAAIVEKPAAHSVVPE